MSTTSLLPPLDLTEQELIKLTGYVRPTGQMKVLTELGIPARRRPDNTILVMRMHCMTSSHQPQAIATAPRLKSSRK